MRASPCPGLRDASPVASVHASGEGRGRVKARLGGLPGFRPQPSVGAQPRRCRRDLLLPPSTVAIRAVAPAPRHCAPLHRTMDPAPCIAPARKHARDPAHHHDDPAHRHDDPAHRHDDPAHRHDDPAPCIATAPPSLIAPAHRCSTGPPCCFSPPQSSSAPLQSHVTVAPCITYPAHAHDDPAQSCIAPAHCNVTVAPSIAASPQCHATVDQ